MYNNLYMKDYIHCNLCNQEVSLDLFLRHCMKMKHVQPNIMLLELYETKEDLLKTLKPFL